MKISCQKVAPKCVIGLFCFLLAFLALLFPAQISAAERSSYYDWGPYYNQTKVLGITFSSLEELPNIEIPANISPTPATGILPGNPFHFFETLTENIQLTLTFDPIKKEEFRLSLASERLSEVKTLVEQGNYQAAEAAAAEYRNTMNAVSDNLQALSAQNNPQATVLAENLEKLSADHAIVAQSAALSSPFAANTTWNQLLTASEKAMDAAAETRGQPAIPEELSVSLQELKNAGLLTPEQSDKLYSLTSRSHVRKELDKLAAAGTFPQSEAAKLDTAIADNYPDIYNQSLSLLKFAELRSYQTLTPPSEEILKNIEEWREQKGNLPPPAEIKPYLYYDRANQLAQTIDFAPFSAELQSEVAKFYPDAVSENSTYTPSPSPAPSPTPTEQTTQETASPQEPAPTQSTTTSPYLAQYNGPLPGTPAYFFKQIGEGAGLFTTTFDPARRMEISMQHAEERLREAGALSLTTGREKDYQSSLERYKSSLEGIIQNLRDYQGNEETRRDLAVKFEAEAARHNVIFEKGLLPPVADNREVVNSVVAVTQNAMDVSADALERPAIPYSLEARLQDLKVQGQLLPEEVDKIVQSQSREEAREKIRELAKLETIPLADIKKLDEGQALVVPQDYNQLVEVRKIEELQRLRAVQSEFAQTATLRQTNANYTQRIDTLVNSIDISLIKPEDFAGREGLVQAYEAAVATGFVRPVNSGQFPKDAPVPADLLLTTCPAGAVFKQFEGCVWEDNGQRINDYEQYRCARPNEYWSFAVKSCVLYNSPEGRPNDASPLCPVGYSWSWESQNCQTGTGGTIVPSPSPEPSPVPGREKTCPAGATYRPPQGCVWEDTGISLYDQDQYLCGKNSYFSFEKRECVPAPEPGEGYPGDTQPICPGDQFWFWGKGECNIPEVTPTSDYLASDIDIQKPVFVAPDSPFYFLKQIGEAVQSATALTTQARQETRLAQAKERFAESLYYLEKKDEKGFQNVLSTYTDIMQDVYNDMPSTEKLSETDQKTIGEKLAKQAVEENLLLQKANVIATTDITAQIAAANSVIIQGVDRAADLLGEPTIPQEVKEKIEALPEEMLSLDKKKEILESDNRLEARLKIGQLVSGGALTQSDTAFLDEDFTKVDPAVQTKLAELQKLNEIADLTASKQDIEEKIEKTEDIAQKLDEFQKTFEIGNNVPAEIRPYVRLTRIDEITQTIRPDIVKLEDFQNRRDIQLAVATLQQEFKPTTQDFRRIEEFRRANPNRTLPPGLARIEALSFSLGVRESAGACFLPSPPFAPNTPCPPTGASIPISSYYGGASSFPETGGFGGERLIVDGDGFKGWRGGSSVSPSVDKDGKPLIYGKGPESTNPGACPSGYHWMYDSGGWCMSNSGSYNSSSYNYTPTGTGSGYTPYSPYYTAPGAPPTSYGYSYTNDPNFINLYSPLPGGPTYTYTPPTYYGTAPTSYTTNPPPGTVPGSGPRPTSPGQCPEGYHWMSDSGGWCMANGGAYTGGGGGYYGNVNPGTQCPAGSYWNSYSGSCQSPTLYPGGPSPNLTAESCGPGYTWTGNACYPNYSGGSGTYTGGSTGTSTGSCSPPGGGCGSGYFDYGSCSCKAASSQGCYNVSASSCGTGFYWDSGACTCRSTSDTSTSTSTYTAPSSSGSTSSGSCPSGYHWMSDSGGWCMSDGTSGGGSTSTYPTPSSTTTSTEPTPAPTTTSSEPAPAPTTTEPAPAPTSEPAPAPAPTTSP